MSPDRDLLYRDRFCHDCLRFREDGRYDNAMKALQSTLWCSHCNESHKRPVFSAQQRAASPATRVCVLAEGKVQICNHKSMGYNWDKDLRLIHSTKEPHQVCQHPDHHLPWYTTLFWEDPSEYPCDPDLIRQGKPHITLTFEKGFSPQIDSQATIILFKLQHQTPVTRAFLQERLRANAHTLERMLCSHVTIEDGQLLLPFCPSRCACFDSMRWDNHSCTDSDIYYCCRCTAAESCGRAGYFLPTSLDRQHTFNCTSCDARYSWDRHGSAVTITIQALKGGYDTTLPKYYRRYSQDWVHKIHPESWGIFEDDELRHIAWCNDIFCTSRWRWEWLSRLLVQ